MRGDGAVEDVYGDCPPEDGRVSDDDENDFPLREGSSPDGIAPPEGKSAPCDAPRPTLQKTSSYSEFRRVFLLCLLFYFCIASCHHAIMSLIFITLLNKLYGFFNPFKSRDIHMVISL